jgi:hypothetical protein
MRGSFGTALPRTASVLPDGSRNGSGSKSMHSAPGMRAVLFTWAGT